MRRRSWRAASAACAWPTARCSSCWRAVARSRTPISRRFFEDRHERSANGLPQEQPMSFQQGLSGLNAAAKNLDAIGNNVANASTIGYKAERAEFADVFANSLSGGGGVQVGIGTKV